MKPGDVIAQRFEVERLAGSGGMGDVYRARDLRTGAAVAVKVVRGQGLEQNARFAREAEVLAGIDHPAVVRYVGQGQTPEGESFLAMEWLEGEALAERISRGRLSLADAAALGFRLAEALCAAHRAGVVHRDLKPSNVMLCGGEIGRAKLVDFGVARAADRTKLTGTGAMLGTIGYMAPEQVRGDRDLDARADVFSLGAVLFKCLTGRAPFEGDDPMTVLLRLATEEAPRLRDCLDDVPPALDDLVARMLSKDGAQRPADGAAVLDELRRLGPFPVGAQPLPVSARAPIRAPVAAGALTGASAPRPAPRPFPVGLVVGLVLAVVVIVAGGVLAVVLWPRAPDAPSARAGAPVPASTDCVVERCEVIDVPNPAAVDLQQIYPKVRAAVLAVDRTAELASINSGGPTWNGLADATKVRPAFNFHVTPATSGPHRGKPSLGATLYRKTLNISWNDGYLTPKVPEPKCSMTRVWAIARGHGTSSTASPLVFYGTGAGGPVWMAGEVTVRDATCTFLR
jgi:hypothetical protein